MKVYRSLNQIKSRGFIVPNSMILGDCLEVMPFIKDNEVDFCLTDPPYGATVCRGDLVVPLESMWVQLKKIVKKDRGIALMASQPFTTDLINSNRKWFKYCWVWIKNFSTNFLNAKRQPLRRTEDIIIFIEDKSYYYPIKTVGHTPTHSAKSASNGALWHGKGSRNYSGGDTDRYPNSIIEQKAVDPKKRIHPLQKPVTLMEYLIKTYTNEGDLVLDFAAGSFTTAIACMNTNRKFICIEKDKEFFEVGVNRVKKHWEAMKAE